MGDRLRELADLHDSGLLTDDEYVAKRADAVERVKGGELHRRPVHARRGAAEGFETGIWVRDQWGSRIGIGQRIRRHDVVADKSMPTPASASIAG